MLIDAFLQQGLNKRASARGPDIWDERSIVLPAKRIYSWEIINASYILNCVIKSRFSVTRVFGRASGLRDRYCAFQHGHEHIGSRRRILKVKQLHWRYNSYRWGIDRSANLPLTILVGVAATFWEVESQALLSVGPEFLPVKKVNTTTLKT